MNFIAFSGQQIKIYRYTDSEIYSTNICGKNRLSLILYVLQINFSFYRYLLHLSLKFPFHDCCILKQLQTKEMAKYILDLTIPCHTFASVLPTVLAASSVYTAQRLCGAEPAWTAGLEHFSGYTEKDLIGCAKQMLRVLDKAPEAKLQVLIFISAHHFLAPCNIFVLLHKVSDCSWLWTLY